MKVLEAAGDFYGLKTYLSRFLPIACETTSEASDDTGRNDSSQVGTTTLLVRFAKQPIF